MEQHQDEMLELHEQEEAAAAEAAAAAQRAAHAAAMEQANLDGKHWSQAAAALSSEYCSSQRWCVHRLQGVTAAADLEHFSCS